MRGSGGWQRLAFPRILFISPSLGCRWELRTADYTLSFQVYSSTRYCIVRVVVLLSMLFNSVFATFMAGTALGAQLTKVNYPNDASSKVDM